MNKQSATIVFHSNDMILENNEYYIKNFKLKETLGDIFDKYNKFNFTLDTFYNNASFTNRRLIIYGLNWTSILQNEPAQIPLQTSNGITQYTSNNSVMFLKPASPIVDLKLVFTGNTNNISPLTMETFVMIVSFEGVEESKDLIPRTMNMRVDTSNLFLHSSNASSIEGGILTFNNIKIKQLLGDMYGKYDKFKLILTGFYNRNLNVLSNNQRLIAIKVKGFDYVGQYDYSYINDNPYIDIPTLGMCWNGSNSAILQQTQANWGCVFNKPSSLTIDLTIYLYTVQNSYTFTHIDYGISAFFFTICGIN
jgi:hypothetical protein